MTVTKKKKTSMPFAKIDPAIEYSLYIIKDRCKACTDCIVFCPKEILELDESQFNKKGYHFPKIKEGYTMADCAGCGYCSLICPEFAIYLVEPKKGEK